MKDHRSYVHKAVAKIKTEKQSGSVERELNVIRTHDLYDTNAVLYQMSYQDNWELVT